VISIAPTRYSGLLLAFLLGVSALPAQVVPWEGLHQRTARLARTLYEQGFPEAARRLEAAIPLLGGDERDLLRLEKSLERADPGGQPGTADVLQATELVHETVERLVEALRGASGEDARRLARAVLLLDPRCLEAGRVLGLARTGDGRFREGEDLARVQAEERLGGLVARAWRLARKAAPAREAIRGAGALDALAAAILSDLLVGGEEPTAARIRRLAPGGDGLDLLGASGRSLPAPVRQGNRDYLFLLAVGRPADETLPPGCLHALQERLRERRWKAEVWLPLEELLFPAAPLAPEAREQAVAFVAWLHEAGRFRSFVDGLLSSPPKGGESHKELLERSLGQPLREVEEAWWQWLGRRPPQRGSVLDAIQDAWPGSLARSAGLRAAADSFAQAAAAQLVERLDAAHQPVPMEPLAFGTPDRVQPPLDLLALHALRHGLARQALRPGQGVLPDLDARSYVLLHHPWSPGFGLVTTGSWLVLAFSSTSRAVEGAPRQGLRVLRTPTRGAADGGIFSVLYGWPAGLKVGLLRVLDGDGVVAGARLATPAAVDIPPALAPATWLLVAPPGRRVAGEVVLELSTGGDSPPLEVWANSRGLTMAPEPGGDGRRPRRGRKHDRVTPEVKRALRSAVSWLLATQREDGSWPGSLDAPGAPDDGQRWDDYGATALAVLALFGAGEQRRDPGLGRAARRGLVWLLEHRADPRRFGWTTGNPAIYEHAITTQVLADPPIYEHAITTRVLADYVLRTGRAQRGLVELLLDPAVRVLRDAWNPRNGWGYAFKPTGENDTSCTCWCARALLLARRAGAAVEPEVFEGARSWIDAMTDPGTGRTGYSFGDGGGPGGPPSRFKGLWERFPPVLVETLTAAALALELALLADGKADREARRAIKDFPRRERLEKQVALLVRKLPVWDEAGGSCDFFYWWFGSEAMARWGGGERREWTRALHATLLPSQRWEPPAAGSWDPAGPWTSHVGGRVMATALAVLALAELE